MHGVTAQSLSVRVTMGGLSLHARSYLRNLAAQSSGRGTIPTCTELPLHPSRSRAAQRDYPYMHGVTPGTKWQDCPSVHSPCGAGIESRLGA